MEVLTWCIDMNGIKNKHIVKCMAYLIGGKKNDKSLLYGRYADDIERGDTKPTLVVIVHLRKLYNHRFYLSLTTYLNVGNMNIFTPILKLNIPSPN